LKISNKNGSRTITSQININNDKITSEERVMTNEEVLLEKFKHLTPDLKKEALNFVDYLQSKLVKKHKRQSLAGIWADFDVNITKEDIDEMRREAWSNFPREHFYETKK
jgi:Protein of unknown function (DUF2281)